MVTLDDFEERGGFYYWEEIEAFCFHNKGTLLSVRLANMRELPEEVRDFMKNYNEGETSFMTRNGKVAVPNWVANSVSLFENRKLGWVKTIIPVKQEEVHDFLQMSEQYVSGKEMTEEELDFLDGFHTGMSGRLCFHLYMDNKFKGRRVETEKRFPHKTKSVWIGGIMLDKFDRK